MAEFPCGSQVLALIPQKAFMLGPQSGVTVVLRPVHENRVKILVRDPWG